MFIVGIRGATVSENSANDIIENTEILIRELEAKNNINPDNVISITFSTTSDLDQAYPAKAARNLGYTNNALMCFQEMSVVGSLKKCIRIMILANLNMNQQSVKHIYLKDAKILRPDILGGKMKDDKVSIAIDGPAGAGKSTIAKLVAKKLNIEYLDTGAMYRAFTLKAINSKIDKDHRESILDLLLKTDIDFNNNHIYLDGIIVDEEIRHNTINKEVSFYAAIKEVRDHMVKIQREISHRKSIIVDGRDIGTVVLPNASFKFFLTASVEERGNRRYNEFLSKGVTNISLEQIKSEIEERDFLDSNRKESPLVQASDAILIDTTKYTIDEVVSQIITTIDRG